MPRPSVASASPRRSRTIAALTTAVALGIGLVFVGVDAGPSLAAQTDCRAIPVDADRELHSDLARAEFGVDGTGVKVGIISNSYSAAGQAAIDANVAQGLLPGPGNPCGRPTPVTELYPSPAGDDEGRAMAQLVHGVAPGAQLFFAPATGDGTLDDDQAAMIQSIDALVAQGADVIVDDITLPDEPFFQESTLSARIGALEAEGVVYLSAAGNETVVASEPLPGQRATPVNGWSTTAFRPTACADYVAKAVTADTRYAAAAFDCMDFATDAEPDSTALFGALPGALDHNDTEFVTAALMQWGEPRGQLSGAFEMVITAIKTTGNGTNGDVCTPTAPCTASGLVSALDTSTPARYSGTFELPIIGQTTDIEISLVRIIQPTADDPIVELTPAIGFVFPNNGAQWIAYAEYAESTGTDLVGRSVIGHNAAAGAITVAATGYRAREDIEPYSSLGPVRYTLSSEAVTPQSPLAEPETRRVPELLSVDGVRQSVLQTFPTGQPGIGYFYGTSAATPNAGAVIALALQLDPDLTTGQVRRYLRETATPLASPYAGIPVEDSVGAGLINAQTLLQRVAADLPSPPAPAVPAGDTATMRTLPNTGAGGTSLIVLVGMLLVVGGVAMRARRRSRDTR